MKKSSGFSLMELLIAVTIIGILAAIAFPAYQDSVIKGNRGAAKAAILEIAQRQKQFLLDNRAYSNTVTALGLTLPEEVTRWYSFAVTAPAGNPPAFTVRATPIAGSRQAKDGWMEINQAGAKTSQEPGKSVVNKWK